MADVWIANHEGTEIVRARDVAGASLDYDGNVTVRMARGDGGSVTVAGQRQHHEDPRPADFHRQLIRFIAELTERDETFLVHAEYHKDQGWAWYSELL